MLADEAPPSGTVSEALNPNGDQIADPWLPGVVQRQPS
jgi:hypothetical protein